MNKFDQLRTSPTKIFEVLSDYVIGQEEAKKMLATALVNNCIIQDFNKRNREVKLKPNNIVLIGPSGTGKTYLVQTIAKLFDYQLISTSATEYSQRGYVGGNLSDLIKEISMTISTTHKPVLVFMDEIDKISSEFEKHHSGTQVSTKSVQMELLKIIESSNLQVDNVMWIFAGAFTDLIKDKLNEIDKKKVAKIGFESTLNDKDKDLVRKGLVLDSEFLLNAGFIHELVGRMGTVVPLQALTKDELRQILINSKESPLKQYEIIGRIRGIDLTLTNSDIEDILDQAEKLKLGARPLQNFIHQKLMTRMYVN